MTTPETLADRLARLRAAINAGWEHAGTMAAKDAVKVRPQDWHAIKAAADALDLDALAQEVKAMVGAEREAIAAFIESHAYCTNGGDTCLEPSRFPGMDRHHATIAAAIRALAKREEG